MSVEFSNVYQEVLLENLDAILKQNFMFQARIKLFEKEANSKAELQAKLDDVTAKYQSVLEQVGVAEQYKIRADDNDAIVQEKTRIQSALNDTMRELASSKGALEAKEVEILAKNIELEKLKSHIVDLEKLIPPEPAPKVVKKLTVKSEEIKPNDFASNTSLKIKVDDGSSF
jgi:multidrug efflux pump subunit AcrA (membrane-fusion protein)